MDDSVKIAIALFGLLVVAAAVGLIRFTRWNNRQRQALIAAYRANGGTDIFTNNALSIIGLLPDSRGLFVGNAEKDGGVFGRCIAPNQLTGSAVVVDSVVVTRGRQRSAIGSAIAGAVIAGPVGAVVGSAVGRKTSTTATTEAQTVTLQVHIDDLAHPIVTLTMPDTKSADEWVQRIDLLMSRA